MDTIFRVFAEVMLWLSLPIFGGLGFWEENLKISDSDRRLIQLLLLVGVFGWIWFWNSQAERAQLSQTQVPESFFSFEDEWLDRKNSATLNSSGERIPFSNHSENEELFNEMEKSTNVTIHH